MKVLQWRVLAGDYLQFVFAHILATRKAKVGQLDYICNLGSRPPYLG